MTGTGRPLRFVGLVTLGWVIARIAMLWHQTGSLPEAIRQFVPQLAGIPAATARADPALRGVRIGHASGAHAVAAHAIRYDAPASATPARAADPARVQMALLAMARFGPAVATRATAAETPMSTAPLPLDARRWSGSGWLIARDGMGAGASAASPQLGGAQAGVRIDYSVGHGFALTGRVAAPAAGAGREASVGIAWRPTGLPIRIVAEQRLALDNGRGGPALGVSGGLYEAMPAGFRLEGYAQAGVIARDGLERYADGIVRLTRPVASPGKLIVDLGVGAWGGAQRGVARLDVGPSASVTLPLAERTVRVAIDWRQRIAGDARPGSGPALSIGSDF